MNKKRGYNILHNFHFQFYYSINTLIIVKENIARIDTVHSTRIPHFPQNSEENLSFARKPTEDIIKVIHKIPWSSAELINFLGGTLER